MAKDHQEDKEKTIKLPDDQASINARFKKQISNLVDLSNELVKQQEVLFSQMDWLQSVIKNGFSI